MDRALFLNEERGNENLENRTQEWKEDNERQKKKDYS